MNEDGHPKSYIKLYWLVWLFLVSALLVTRFAIIKTYNEDALFNLFLVYIGPTWLALMGLNFFEGRRLMSYLRRHHYEKWEYLTYVPGFGSGGVNSFRSLPFLLSGDGLNDPHVKRLKSNYRRFAVLILTVFLSSPILFIVITWEY